jgi:type I restriction enzyme S subunit
MSEWCGASLDEVVSLKRGFDLPESQRRLGNYPVLGSSGISGWHDKGPVKGPGVTIGRSGASIGVATYFEGDYWPLNTALFVEDFKGNYPRYVYYLLDNLNFASFDSGSAQPSLNRNYIANIRIMLPARGEQEAIAMLLGALDDKIAVNDRIATTANSLLKAHFSVTMQNAEREARLGELVELKYGKALKEEDRAPGQIPVFGGNGISGWHDAPLSNGPGIIVGRKGANAGSVSWSQGPFWPIDTAFYVDSASGSMPLEFLLFLLECAGLRNIVGDSAIPGLNREMALSITVRLPTEDGIKLFTETAKPLLAMNAQITEESRVLAQLRDTLLPRLMSGEIRVRDAEKAVEDVT